MAISIKKARDFVYANGVLWERALFAYHFEGAPVTRLHQCLMCYKNPDNGFGHALEHDARTPDSHPLALEYILGHFVGKNAPPKGSLFDGSAAWVESVQQPDGSLANPDSFLDYPHAPWWNDGGQTMPDSIVGNLTKMALVTPTLAENTRRWVQVNLTLDKIRANEWLFMQYHGFDYFMNVDDFPDVETYRAAVIDNIVALAENLPESQYESFMRFVPTPDSPVAQRVPHIVKRVLDYLSESQQDDGRWTDQHGLAHWQPVVTIGVLGSLRTHGRL